MQNWFTVTLQACKMQDLPSHTEVFNLAQIPEILCIKLPDSLPRDMELSGIYDLTNNKEIEFADNVTRSEHRPWIDINSSILDMTSGQHIYRMTFTKEGLALTALCWFSYVIQNTFVDRPYIYMKREDNSSEEENE